MPHEDSAAMPCVALALALAAPGASAQAQPHQQRPPLIQGNNAGTERTWDARLQSGCNGST